MDVVVFRKASAEEVVQELNLLVLRTPFTSRFLLPMKDLKYCTGCLE